VSGFAESACSVSASRFAILLLLGLGTVPAQEPPYSTALDDALNLFDAPVPGFVGPHGDGQARLYDSWFNTYTNPDNIVNPLFFGWADGVADYSPALGVSGEWAHPSRALGPVSGDNFHVVSLGDLDENQIGKVSPGSITLTFAKPIRNKAGADFVVFENGFFRWAGGFFGELAYVEVSSNGTDFARFPSRSLTPQPVGSHGVIDSRNVFGLAGKHANADGESWGTPFDLSALEMHHLIGEEKLDLNEITHVRIVDIPGNGHFEDSHGKPIYDAWHTTGSGGFDLEAVGVISHEMSYTEWAGALLPEPALGGKNDDAAGDGLPNLFAYALGRAPTLPDPAPATRAVVAEGRMHLEFTRDERAVDLVYKVQVSGDLSGWSTIARSVDGRRLEPVDGHEPLISEESESEIASVGVIRRVRVSPPPAARQFLRLRITEKQP